MLHITQSRVQLHMHILVITIDIQYHYTCTTPWHWIYSLQVDYIFHTHTHTTDYRNPRACALRVNNGNGWHALQPHSHAHARHVNYCQPGMCGEKNGIENSCYKLNCSWDEMWLGHASWCIKLMSKLTSKLASKLHGSIIIFVHTWLCIMLTKEKVQLFITSMLF